MTRLEVEKYAAGRNAANTNATPIQKNVCSTYAHLRMDSHGREKGPVLTFQKFSEGVRSGKVDATMPPASPASAMAATPAHTRSLATGPRFPASRVNPAIRTPATVV